MLRKLIHLKKQGLNWYYSLQTSGLIMLTCFKRGFKEAELIVLNKILILQFKSWMNSLLHCVFASNKIKKCKFNENRLFLI